MESDAILAQRFHHMVFEFAWQFQQMSGSRSVQQTAVLSLGTNGDVRRLLPYVLHHSTVAYSPLLMVQHSQSWKNRQDFTPFQWPDADRGGSFVGIPTQTLLQIR